MITFKEYLSEMSRHQYVVVDSTGKRNFMTADRDSAERIAKQKGMKVVQRFYPKDRDFIPLKIVQ